MSETWLFAWFLTTLLLLMIAADKAAAVWQARADAHRWILYSMAMDSARGDATVTIERIIEWRDRIKETDARHNAWRDVSAAVLVAIPVLILLWVRYR